MDPEEANAIATRAAVAMCQLAYEELPEDGMYLAAVLVQNERRKGQLLLATIDLPDDERRRFLELVIDTIQQEIAGETVGRRKFYPD